MLRKTVLACLALACILGVPSAAERNYKKCKNHKDPSFSKCLEDAANIYFANIDEEVGGTHRTFKPINLTVNNGPMAINVTYNITKFVNSTKSAKVTLKYDDTKKRLSGTISAPHVGFDQHFDVDGKFANLKLQGVGVAMLHIWDMEASFETKLHIKPETETNFEMGDLKFKINKIRNAKIEVLEINAGNKAFENTMKQGIETFANQIYASAKVIWDTILKLHYEDLTREFLTEMLDDGLVINDR